MAKGTLEDFVDQFSRSHEIMRKEMSKAIIG